MLLFAVENAKSRDLKYQLPFKKSVPAFCSQHTSLPVTSLKTFAYN